MLGYCDLPLHSLAFLTILLIQRQNSPPSSEQDLAYGLGAPMCRSEDVLDVVLALSDDGHEDESFFQADPSPQNLQRL